MDSFEFTNHVNIVIDREDRFLGHLQIGLGIVSILCEIGVIIFVSWCQEGTNYYIDLTDYSIGSSKWAASSSSSLVSYLLTPDVRYAHCHAIATEKPLPDIDTLRRRVRSCYKSRL